MASIRLENVEKVYPGGTAAVHGLNLEATNGEFLVLVGPSGCGKSTALRLVAGLETPTAGRVLLGDRDVTALSPQQRDVAMVFQSYALYPHKTVRQNLEFGLRMRRTEPAEIDQRVAWAAGVLGLEGLLERKPRQLSGGQRQRVALGRAIVRQPQAFLLDEPLSNLDARLRVETRAELARMHRQLGATMLYVTHDQEEAMTLGDRIAVMRDGRLQQVAPPMELYHRPANMFVASFIGSPAMNFFQCHWVAKEGGHQLVHPAVTLTLDQAPEARPPRDVVLGIRPEDIHPAAPDKSDVKGRIDVVQPLGSQLLVYLKVPEASDASLAVLLPSETAVKVDQTLAVRFRRDRLHLFDPKERNRLPR